MTDILFFGQLSQICIQVHDFILKSFGRGFMHFGDGVSAIDELLMVGLDGFGDAVENEVII